MSLEAYGVGKDSHPQWKSEICASAEKLAMTSKE